MSSSKKNTDNATNKLLNLLRKKEADKDIPTPESAELDDSNDIATVDDAVLKYVFNDVDNDELEVIDEFTETVVEEKKLDDELDFDKLVFQDIGEEEEQVPTDQEQVDEDGQLVESSSVTSKEGDDSGAKDDDAKEHGSEPIKSEKDENDGDELDFKPLELHEETTPGEVSVEDAELGEVSIITEEAGLGDEIQITDSSAVDSGSMEEPAILESVGEPESPTVIPEEGIDEDLAESIEKAENLDDVLSIPGGEDVEVSDIEFEDDHPKTFVYHKTSPAKFLVRKSRIGIDIGTYALKYIKTLEAKNSNLIEGYGYYKYPTDVFNDPEKTEKHVVQVLQDILSQKENKKARINIIAKGSDVGIKSIQMPKMAKKNMNDAVSWATQKSLSFSEGETITDFLITGEVEEDGIQKNEILVIAALDSLLHENLDRIPGKIIPHKITLVPIALWRYFVNIYATVRKDNIMVIDIGYQTTMINVLNKRNLKFAREVGVAGKEFTKAVSGSYTDTEGGRILVDEEAAEHLKIKYGVPELEAENKLTENGISLGQISSRLKQSVEKLISEIERSLNFYTKEFALGNIEQIYLCGGSAALKNIDKLIYQALDIKTEVIDLFNQWTLGNYVSDISLLQSCAPALVVPAGLAMDTSPKLNLLPRNLFHIVYSKYIKNMVRVYAALVAVILFSVSTLAFVNSKSIIKQLLQEQETVNQLGPQQKRYLQYKDEYNDRLNKISILKKNLSESTIDEQVLIIMSNLMPENVVLTSMLMDKSNNSPVTSVNFSGYIITDTFDANVKLAEFIYRLQNSAYMKNITLKKSQPVNFHSRSGIFFEILGNVENYEA